MYQWLFYAPFSRKLEFHYVLGLPLKWYFLFLTRLIPAPPATPRFSNWSGDAKPSLMIARYNHEGSSDSKIQIYYDSVKIELTSRFHENLRRVRLRSKLLTNESHFIKSWKYAQQVCYICPYNVLQP